jgi:hypothetical protein
MKKNLFFNRYVFLLAIAALLCFTSCQKSEQAIRAEVEKEIMLKVDSLLQTPKHILSTSETQLVVDNFKNVKFQDGVETTVCKLPNGTAISVLLEKKSGYKIFAQYGDTKEEALMQAVIPIAIHPTIVDQVQRFIPPPFSTKIPIPIEISYCDQPNEEVGRRACIDKCIRNGFTPRWCEFDKCRYCLQKKYIGAILKFSDKL